MLDEKSIDVINRLKETLANNSAKVVGNSKILLANRGNKLLEEDDDSHLTSKVVEYNGVSYWVSSNKMIDNTRQRNKRKWKEYYESTEEYKRLKASEPEEEVDDEETSSPKFHDDKDDEFDDEEEEDEEEDEDSNPLHDFDITEILLALSHPSELVSHPAILKTYQLDVLSKIALELIDLIEIEQKTLNDFNKLLYVLNGEDWFYLLEENLGLASYDHGLTGDNEESNNKDSSNNNNNDTKPSNNEIPQRITRTKYHENDEVVDPFFKVPQVLERYEELQSKLGNEVSDPDDKFNEIREDLINYLQVSIQRQQEYIKNLTSIRNHLIRADRLKSNLLKWGKEMYDKKSN